MRTRSALWWIILASACSASPSHSPAPTDAGVINVPTRLVCEDRDAAVNDILKTIPDLRLGGLTFFHEVGSPCLVNLASVFSLENSTASAVAVQQIGTNDDRFLLQRIELPVVLDPGARMEVPMVFEPAMPAEVSASLAVMTSAGCVSFPIRGNAVSRADGPVTVASHQALDFGTVASGQLSSIHEFTLTTTSRDVVFDSFTTSPQAFEIATPAKAVEAAEGCQRLTLGLRFRAPTDAGTATGQLGFFVTKRGSDLEGSVLIGLVGSASPTGQ